MLKRVVDIVLGAIGLLLSAPLLVILAGAIKLESRGPVFYLGLRAGRGGKPFKIFKLRSMVVDAEAVGGPSTADDDSRITRIGAFVRRFKLDELPQLLNVINGTMSFVGPRPEVMSEVAEYDREQRCVLELRPGITDWATIWNADEGAVLAGADDPHQAYKELIQPTKLRLQLRYYECHSLWIDLKIILYTLIKMIRREWLPAELRPYGVPVAAGKPTVTGKEG